VLRYTFSRQERLKSRKTIGRLFTEGKSYIAYPLRVVWMPLDNPAEDTPPVQMAVSVSKRFFKTAVDRNRMKRLIREAYRLHKHVLYDKLSELQQPPVAMMLICLAKEPLTQAEMEEGMRKLVVKWGVK
jgi:ribonuclease P protein component